MILLLRILNCRGDMLNNDIFFMILKCCIEDKNM